MFGAPHALTGVCSPNDRTRVEALRSFLQGENQPAEMQDSTGSSHSYDPMRSSELDDPSDSSTVATEEEQYTAADDF
eukprot:COSAG02_NODE_48075_length_336_cov_0.932489_1_plen_76_part_10